MMKENFLSPQRIHFRESFSPYDYFWFNLLNLPDLSLSDLYLLKPQRQASHLSLEAPVWV